MAKLISKTYGDALFEIAVEENKPEKILEEVTDLLNVIREDKDFKKFMDSPKVPKEEKIKVVENVFTDRLDKDTLGFLVTIIEKDRYEEIEAILQYVIDEIKEYLSIGTAYIVTATPLTNEEKEMTKNKLLQTTKYKKIECNYDVDASIIGGMIIRMKDKVVDSSVRNKLEKLERELLNVQLAN